MRAGWLWLRSLMCGSGVDVGVVLGSVVLIVIARGRSQP